MVGGGVGAVAGWERYVESMRFDFFIALDGHGLNGFEGFAGVARLRCEPDAGVWEPDVKFFDGVAGGHAV